jgi:CheY-like chemotaxis protein
MTHPSGRPKVVIVEDNPMNVELVTELLLARGCEVFAAGDASAGIELARTHRPRLVLMDYQLPGKMNGLEAARALKADAKTRHIPILVITAHAFDDLAVSVREAGCEGYITKPLDTRRFLAAIEGYLKGKVELV